MELLGEIASPIVGLTLSNTLSVNGRGGLASPLLQIPRVISDFYPTLLLLVVCGV